MSNNTGISHEDSAGSVKREGSGPCKEVDAACYDRNDRH